MRATVDLDKCVDHGQCVFSAPGFFSLDQNGKLSVDHVPSQPGVERLGRIRSDDRWILPAGDVPADVRASEQGDRGSGDVQVRGLEQ